MRMALTVAAACVAGTGCGDGSTAIPAGADGPVVFQDSLADDSSGWFEHEMAPHRDGRWEWDALPAPGVKGAPDALPAARTPEAVSVAVDVTMREGAGLRAVACRQGPPAENGFEGAYELGIDGRRALIRKIKVNEPPLVLAAKDLPVSNGKRARLVGRCLPDDEGLALTLVVDGKVVAQARDARPRPNGTAGLHAYPRPDSPGEASLTWDEFVVRKATKN